MGLGTARAAPERPQPADVDLPLAGLRVNLVLPPGMTWRVHSRWGADHYEDVLTLAADGRDMTYTIELAGRTAKDCPLANPFPLELGGEVWIEDRGAPVATLCRMLLDARAIVRITSTTDLDLLSTPRALELHTQVLRPLLDSLRVRRLIPGVPPPLPPPDGPLPETLQLPTVGLHLTTPTDAMRWRVMPPADRDFEALVRELPVFPEVQIAVRRHTLAEVSSCARLMRHLLNALWKASPITPPSDWTGLVGKRHGRFVSLAMCRPQATALLDVRVAARPAIPLDALQPILDALAASREVAAPPPSPLPGAPMRAVLTRTALVSVGLAFPGTRVRGNRLVQPPPGPYTTLDLGMSYVSRNGLALAGSVAVGVDRAAPNDLILGASFEIGVALGLDPDLTFVLALGAEDRREALFDNRALTLVLDMRSNQHVPNTFAWSLRLTPLLLASREPAITGLPLAISWTGMFESGFAFGVDLRWISSPPRPSAAWPAEGLAFALRVGWGDLGR